MTILPRSLAPYRVVDLTEGGADLAGKIFRDLGAEVVKVEPPGGSRSRRRSPRADETPEAPSLFWLALNAGKSRARLDLETASGRRRLLQMVATADFLVESFRPGYLAGLGLGHTALRAVNPGLIQVSITPFCQTGPYAGYAASDLTIWEIGRAHV